MNFFSDIINKKDFKVLFNNFLSLTSLQFINFILPLLTLPYLVRVLGVEKFGLVSFALSIVMYLDVLVSFGFELSATQQISVSRNNLREVGKIFSNVIAAKLLLLLFSALILFCLVFSIRSLEENAFLYFATFGIVISNFLMPTWLFQGMEDMKYITIISFISKAIFTILMFIIIKDSSDYIYVPILTTIGTFISAIYSIWLAFRTFKIPLIIPCRTDLVYQIRISYVFFLSRLSNTVSRYYAITIIGICFSNLIVGYYTMVEKLFVVFNSIGGIVSQTIYPYMSRTKNIIFLRKILVIITGASFLLICPVLYYHELLLHFVFGISNQILSNIFLIIFSGSIFAIISAIIGFPLLAAFGYIKYANYSLVYSSIIYIVFISSFAIFNPNIYIISFGLPLYVILGLLWRIYYIRKIKLL